MTDQDLGPDGHVERVRTALAGLAPEQSEQLVRMVELGAMICLVEEAALGRGFGGADLPVSTGGAQGRRGRRDARMRSRAHAGAS